MQLLPRRGKASVCMHATRLCKQSAKNLLAGGHRMPRQVETFDSESKNALMQNAGICEWIEGSASKLTGAWSAALRGATLLFTTSGGGQSIGHLPQEGIA